MKSKVKKYSEEKLKSQFMEYSKLKGGPLMEDEARTMFRIRTLMMPAKLNMKSDPKFAGKLWKCDQCQKLDSQSHILWCPFFAPLREGRDINDDKDLVDNFTNVFKIREDLETN